MHRLYHALKCPDDGGRDEGDGWRLLIKGDEHSSADSYYSDQGYCVMAKEVHSLGANVSDGSAPIDDLPTTGLLTIWMDLSMLTP